MHVQEAAACGNHQPDWQHASADIRKSRQTIHQILSQILTDYEKQQFNTVVSGCMKLLNELNTITISHEMDEHCIHEGFSILLRTLAPIAPHICHQLWHDLGFEGAIIDAPWPRVDKMALKAEEVEYIVQINGKIRTKFMTHASTEEPALIALAKDALTPLVGTPEYQKIIVVAHRKLINLVVR